MQQDKSCGKPCRLAPPCDRVHPLIDVYCNKFIQRKSIPQDKSLTPASLFVSAVGINRWNVDTPQWEAAAAGWRSAVAHAMTGPLRLLRVAAVHWLGITCVLMIPRRGSSRKDVPQTPRQAQWTARWALPTVVPLCRWDRRALRAGPYTSLPGCPMQQAPQPQPPQHRPPYETSSLLPR